ncbi:MAG: polysaccharide deacetylase family protein [Bacteroidales bacterium]
MELLIYTRNLTPRVEYIFRFIFKDILRINYRVTTSITEAQGYYGPLMSYSHQKFDRGLQIVPNGLLTESGVRHHSFEVLNWDGLPAFPLTAPDTEIPFDIFSASFYLITRYEEYTCSRFKLDKHGRFGYLLSIASQNGFLHLSIVDLWAYKLLDIFKARNFSLTIKQRKFKQITTLDLDSAYAIKSKGLLRMFLSSLKSMLAGRNPAFVKRIKVSMGLSIDPFDIYDELFDILPISPQTIWFVHAGRWGKYDKSIPINSSSMKILVNRLAEKFRIGIHPSYSSFLNEQKTRSELSELVDALDQSVACSRQHYLRIRVPQTYRILQKMGITEDYSMGYSDNFGFRAGTCTPFIFYDLLAEQTLSIKVIPFQVMDSALVRSRVSPDESHKIIQQLIDSVKQVDGTFVSVWHVDYLSGYEQSKGWFDSLKKMLMYLRSFQNAN